MSFWQRFVVVAVASAFLAWVSLMGAPLLSAPDYRDRISAVLGLAAIGWLYYRLIRFAMRSGQK